LKKKYPRMEGRCMEGDLSCYGQRSRSQLWDDNKFPYRSQYGATPAPAILAGSRSERLLLISDREIKTKRHWDGRWKEFVLLVAGILNVIPILELLKVFPAWIKRLLDWVSGTEALYSSS
jgi:hypothetical protein